MARQNRPVKGERAKTSASGNGMLRWILTGTGTMVVMVVVGFLAARDSAHSFEWIRGTTTEAELSILPSPAFSYHQLRASGPVAAGSRKAASGGIGVERIVWSVNGKDVGEGPLLAPDHFRRGDLVQVRVEQVLGPDQASIRATASATIANSAPRIQSARIVRVPSRPEQVVANVEATDPDGDPLGYQLTWKVDGKVWDAAQGRVADITRLERGKTLTVDVVVDDGEDRVTATTSPFSVDNQPPTLDIAAAPVLEDTDDGGRRAVLGVSSVDSDGDRVVVETVDAPDGVRFDAKMGALVWAVMDGSHSFDVILRARDDRGGSAERTVTLKR